MKYHLIFFLFSMILPYQQVPNKGDEILGIWQTDDAKAKIEIYKKAGEYFGKIVWLKEPKNDEGKAKVDKENPDKSLKTRPILGVNLVSGFKFDGDDRWKGGEIYDPENGKTYASYMRIRRGKLEVRGYIGLTMFGRTVTWTRSEL